MKGKSFVNRKKARSSILVGALCFLSMGFIPVHAYEPPEYAQTTSLTVRLESKTTREVFDYIEKHSEFVFLYYENMAGLNRKVSLDITDKPVTEILDKLFHGTKLSYVIEDRQIVITQKNSDSMASVQQQKITLKGKVLDDLGEPLPGAAIIVVGSTRGVTTDLDGSFELEVSPADKLNFSFLGMQDQTISVGNQRMLVVKLLPKVDELQEVTVVAFGKQKKESVIGAITSLDASNLKLPVAKLSTSLAGQLAGIVSIQNNPEPGTSAQFWIRGINTFGANNTPLVLVDGIERSMDLVDPEDIASFSILKDAAATAVYGVRGANGIVLITTKRGKESKPTVDMRVEYGIANPIRLPELASASQWMDYYNDLSLQSNTRLSYQPEDIRKYINQTDPDFYPNVDWVNLMYRNVSTSTRANVNVTGGSKNVRYYVAGSFYTEGSIFNPEIGSQYDPSMRYNKFNFRTNIDIDVTPSTELNLSLSNQYETKNRLGIDVNSMYSDIVAVPNIAVTPVFSDGSRSQPLVGSNPYLNLNDTGYSEDFWNNAQSLMGLTQDFSNLITPGLKANIKFSWDARNEKTFDKRKSPPTFRATGRDDDDKLILVQNRDGNEYLSIARSNRGSRTINFEGSLNYDRMFAEKHRVGALFLYNMRSYEDEFSGGNNDYLGTFPNRYIGIAGRATYSFMDKYFAEFNFGYNGSENFAPGRRFGFFPSGAIGYMISNEKYFEPLLHIIDLLKIRGSYGEIGNDKIGGDRRFAYIATMINGGDGGGSYMFGYPNYTLNGIATGDPGNPNVSWETAKKTDIGLELGFFNKLKIQADYFNEQRDGIYIQQKSVPSVVGINVQQWVNLGKMKNQGFDMSLEYNQKVGKVQLSGRGTFTYNRNVRQYDDAPTPQWAYRSEAGFAQEQQRGLMALGLFESYEDIAASPKQTFSTPRPGDIKYRDINSDGIIDDNDKVAIGRTIYPEINYGFGLSAMWNGFDFSVFFQGVGNVTRIIGGSSIYGESGNIFSYGQIYADAADNRWREDTRDVNAKYPRFAMDQNNNNYQTSTFWQRDMSYIRLKNAEIGYTIPKRIVKKLGLANIRIYSQGVNLLTFSKFKLWDPELDTSDGKKYPQMRNANIGLNVNF